MSDEYKPRFSFEISEDQKTRADKILDVYGLRRAIFCCILDDVLDLVESYGGIAIGAMLSKKVRPRDIIPSMKKAEEIGNG